MRATPAWGEASLTGLFDLMVHPALWLSLCLALLYAAIFHAWQGRTLGGLGWFILASLAGFAAGHFAAVSYTHLRAHETVLDLVCRLLLETKKTYN